MNINILGTRLLVKPAQENRSIGKIIIPDSVDKPAVMFGEILKLAKDVDLGVDLKRGDTVVFKKFAPEEIEYEGETLFVIEQDDIIAMVK
jgi:chaperonin GroES